MTQNQIDQHYDNVDKIIRVYWQNNNWAGKQKLYVSLLQELQDYIAKDTGTYGNENSLHEDVEEVQKTINLVQKYL